MAEHLKYLNDENFKESISKGVTLVDFMPIGVGLAG